MLFRSLEEQFGRLESSSVRYRVIHAPKLSEELVPVFGQLSAGNAAPSSAQFAAVNELSILYQAEAAAHNQFLKTSVPAWNEELRKLNLLGITAATPIE